jgi:hypothetical protein
MDEKLLNLNPLGQAPEGWKYKDFRKMPEANWDGLLAILGEGNYRLITTASYTVGGRTYKRGQMFISEAGLKNAKAYVNKT